MKISLKAMSQFECLIIANILTIIMPNCDGHGRLIEPPSRSSAFRYGFATPPNFNDHELYCGGFERHQQNNGKCGECGDAWDLPEPRPHEYGGKWGQGIVVRRYKMNLEIVIRVELTVSHMGYFEFRLCPNPQAKQECLDKHLLQLINDFSKDPTTKFYPRNGSTIYEIKAILPKDLECANCVIQWRYIAANNWGMCSNGTGAMGCGPQEEFRACADIAIGTFATEHLFQPVAKVTPYVKISDITQTTPKSKNETKRESKYKMSNCIISLFIAIVVTVTLLCILAAVYIYHYHCTHDKQLPHWNQHNEIAIAPPVIPPYVKRLSQTLYDIHPTDSNVISGFSR